jgi:acyl-CoA hydrolase
MNARDDTLLTTYRLVMPEHLNHYGFLFGGNLLKWVDETAWMAVSLAYPNHRFVTVGLERVAFRHGARDGNVLRIDIRLEHKGRTSLACRVRVLRSALTGGSDREIFNTVITFVRVNSRGRKLAIGKRRET